MWKGFSCPLEQEDLYSILDNDRAEDLTKRLKKKWENEIWLARKSKRNPRFWKALLRFFTWKEYGLIVFTMLSTICSENVFWFSTIKFLDLLWIESSSDGGTLPYQRLLIYACFMLIANLFRGWAKNHFFLQGAILGIRARAAVVGILYKRVSKINI